MIHRGHQIALAQISDGRLTLRRQNQLSRRKADDTLVGKAAVAGRIRIGDTCDRVLNAQFRGRIMEDVVLGIAGRDIDFGDAIGIGAVGQGDLITRLNLAGRFGIAEFVVDDHGLTGILVVPVVGPVLETRVVIGDRNQVICGDGKCDRVPVGRAPARPSDLIIILT